MTTRVRIGHLTSSRMPDLHRLFALWPHCTVVRVRAPDDLEGLGALLAGGGPDLHPSLYGQPNRWARGSDVARDHADAALLRQALQRGTVHPAQHAVQLVGQGAVRLGAAGWVNSSHHQGVDRLAPSLKTIGFAPDGLPEAWVRPGALGVQFHPETLVHQDARWMALFDWWLSGVPAGEDR